MKDELNRIGSLGQHGDVEELVELLAHEDWQVRRAAVEAIVARALDADTARFDRLVDELLGALYSERNAGLRSAAQEALMRLAPRCTRRLLAEVDRADTDVRILLAPVLGGTGSAEAIPPLIEMSRSADLNVATAAIIGLGRLRRREILD